MVFRNVKNVDFQQQILQFLNYRSILEQKPVQFIKYQHKFSCNYFVKVGQIFVGLEVFQLKKKYMNFLWFTLKQNST